MSIQPKLKQFDLTMIIVSLVIGVGIFRTPATVAAQAGTPLVFYMAWIIGGVVSICGALTFAEIGSRLPAAGGYYKIFSAAYHPVYAFMLNWSQVIINAGSSAGVALIGAEYIAPVLFPDANTVTTIRLIAAGIIAILFLINYAGIRMGARTQNVLSLLKILLITICCAGLFFQGNGEQAVATSTTHDINIFTALGFCFISIFFTYGGYQQTVNFGGDIPEPQKNVPRAVMKGMSIVIVLYLCLNFTYVHVIGFEAMKSSPLLASSLAGAIFGDAGSRIASVILFISVLGFLNTSLMSNPRVYYAMADEGILPRIFKKVNPKTQTQEFGLSFYVTVMLISIFALGTFENIVNYVIFIDSLSLASAAIAVFILRKKTPIGFNGFRIKGITGIIVPAIFAATLLFVTYSTVRSDVTSAKYAFAIFALGFPLYYAMRSLLSRRKETDKVS